MNFFSFAGRVGRKEWWIVTVTTTITGFIASLLAAPAFGYLLAIVIMMTFGASLAEEQVPLGALAGASVALLLLLVSVYAYLAASIKRYHDRGKSGWWMLVTFIPLIGWFWQLIELGFLEGSAGDNAYGSALVSAAPVPAAAVEQPTPAA